MISDPIADILSRIKNAYLARHKEMVLPHSKAKEEIAKILVREGYLKKLVVTPVDKKSAAKLTLSLKYKNGQPALTDLKRVSKPGIRVYKKRKKIPYPYGLGITIVSTPKGIMTGKQARKEKLGGEIICKVW